MTISRVHPGQTWSPPAAAEANQIAEAAEWVAAHRRGDSFDRGRRQRDYDTILLQNLSGGTVERGQVLAIGEPIHADEPADEPEQYAGRPIHEGNTPVYHDDCGRFAIADEVIAGNAIGRTIASGLAVAWVNISDDCHRWADVTNGTASLQSYPAGSAHIEWSPGGTGLQLCLVKIGHRDPSLQRFVLTGRLECGKCAPATQTSCAAGDCADPACDVTVCDRIGIVPAAGLAPGQSVYAQYMAGTGWEVIAVGSECADESSDSDSDSSDSSSKSSSEPSSDSGGCDYSGSVTVGKGDLRRVGDTVCESQVTLTFEDGLLCSVADAGQKCVYICCDSDSSSEPSSDSSSEPPSSEPPSDSGSEPPSSEPPSSEPPSSEPPSSEPPSSGSSSAACHGYCVWIAVDDGSSGSDSSETANCGACLWAWSELTENWRRVSYACNVNECPAAECEYPQVSGTYEGETIVWPCTVPN